MADQPSEEVHHRPVMAEVVTRLLITDPTGAYLDLTAGSGGHLKAMAEKLDCSARLYGADADPEAVARIRRQRDQIGQLQQVIQTPFADIAETVTGLQEKEFDGILFDLGISSDQLDDPGRGLSFRLEAPLDMRLNREAGLTAGDLVNSLDERELKEILRKYGEERRAAGIARAIVKERQRGMILTTNQLGDIVSSVTPEPHRTKALARVFQALRIAVNRELEQLSRGLPAAFSLLKPGGRMAVIAYHSLEDRTVKRFFADLVKGVCTCPPGLPVCVCGARPSARLITRKPVVPTAEEISRNSRARSARLRVAEKVN